MRRLTLLLSMLLGWLQYSLWLGKNGMEDLMRIEKKVIAQKNSNLLLKERNDRLFLEINDLNNTEEAIEERSRHELGMIKAGETFYRLVREQIKNEEVASLEQGKQ